MREGGPERYLIGLTGNIATGKSTVAAMLRGLGATVIDADRITHQVMAQDEAVRAQIAARFGAGILDAEGQIDRRRLGEIVFSDPEALRQLEHILHPAVGQRVQALLQAAETPVVVVEAIKLIEAGWHRAMHALWVTDCRREQQVERLMQSRGLSRAEAEARIEAQPPQAHKVALADVVIDTSSDIATTRRQVLAAWSKIGGGQ